MIDLTPLQPGPGNYQTPVMRFTAIDSTSDRNIIRLVFETTNGDAKLLIGVPVPAIDVAGLLRIIRRLQERGMVPIVPEGDPSKQN